MTQPMEPLTEREEEIWRLYCVSRLSQQAIADRFEISNQRVSQILAAIRLKLPPVDIDAVRQQSLRLHQDIQRRAFEIADMNGAPITAGKDGDVVYDPEDNSVARDYGGRIAAMRLALEADKEIRKLLGADAASKTETTGTLRYEIVGVDPGQLT